MQVQESILPHLEAAHQYLVGFQTMAIHVINHVLTVYEPRVQQRCLLDIIQFVELLPEWDNSFKCKALHEIAKITLTDLSLIQNPTPLAVAEIWRQQSPDCLQGSPSIPQSSSSPAPSPPLIFHESTPPLKRPPSTSSHTPDFKPPSTETADLYLQMQVRLLTHCNEHPNDSMALSCLGELYRVGRGKVDQDQDAAHDYFLKALLINPTSKIALIGLGEIYSSGTFKIFPDAHIARNYFERALVEEPTNDAALASLGSLLLQNGRTQEQLQESKTLLEKAVSLNSKNRFAQAQLYQLLLIVASPQAAKLSEKILQIFEDTIDTLLKEFSDGETAKVLVKTYLKELSLRGKATTKQLQTVYKCSQRAFHYNLKTLINLNIVSKNGAGKHVYYQFAQNHLSDVVHFYTQLDNK